MEQIIEKRNKDLTRRIMRRVYVITVIRTVLHPVFLKSLVAVVFFWRSTTYVSYTNVIANAPSLFDIERDISFYRSAFTHAETTTVALVFAIGALAIWITFDMLNKRSQAWL